MTTRHISRRKDILNGTPVIAGTRIPLERISELLRQGYNEKNIQEEFSHVSPTRLRGAMYELSLLGLEHLEETDIGEFASTQA